MPFVLNDGAHIHWTAQGAGTPVLLIMGHRCASDMWYPLTGELARHHRVITFDNRGTGESDTSANVTIEQLTADAVAVLDAAGEPRAHVYGVSMGGAIAAEFGMAHPDRVISLTLGCTMLKTGETTHSLPMQLIYRLPHWLLNNLMFFLSTPKSYGSAASADRIARDRKAMARSKFTTTGIRAQSKAITRYATTIERAQQRLTMPVLVFHGDEDGLVPVQHGRDLAAMLPHSTYVELKGAGHNYLIAAGDEAQNILFGFIDRADRLAR